MWHSPITLENFSIFTHTHNWLNSDLQTSLKSVRELVFILQKHLLSHSSFLEELILWGFTLSLFFFFCQFIISIHIYLLLSIFFFKNRNGDHFQIQLSLDTFETFSSGSWRCMYLCAYYILYSSFVILAHCLGWVSNESSWLKCKKY